MPSPMFTRIAGKIAEKTSSAIQEAVNWFRTSVTTMVGGNVQQQIQIQTQVTAQEKTIQEQKEKGLFFTDDTPEIGSLYLFKYDAKWKHKLPYWDEFPLVFPFQYAKNGFIGINIHYLPIAVRTPMMSDLEAIGGLKQDEYMSKETRLFLQYNELKQNALMFKYWYKQCIHRYLYTHVRTQFNKVNPLHWHHAAILPTEKWVFNSYSVQNYLTKKVSTP